MDSGIVLSIALIALFTLVGWNWPKEDVVVLDGFAQPYLETHRRGIVLQVPDGETIRPIKPGEVVFSMRPLPGRNHTPHPLGEFVVLQHDNGFLSLYTHLETHPLPNQIDNGVIGRSGESGYALTEGFELRIIDRLLGGYVNPGAILPRRVDDTAPELEGVMLGFDGHTLPLSQRNVVPATRVELILLATGERFSVIWDGAETNMTLDRLIEVGGRLAIAPGGQPLDTTIGIGNSHAIRLMSLDIEPGMHRLTITIWNASGAMATSSFIVEGGWLR